MTTGVQRRDFLKSAGVLAAWGAPAPPSADKEDWVKTTYRQLHIDAHLAGCPDVYKEFDAEAAARTIADAGFQSACYFAVCHGGYSYYPTKIGVVHPGLRRDFTGEMTAALKKRGLRTITYLKAGWDRQHHKLHPEWIYNRDPARKAGDPTGEEAQMCLNSPWVDEVEIPQMKEILSLYSVDGYFLDIVLHQYIESNCYCQYCRQSFAREVGGDMPTSDKDANAFAYRIWANRHLEAYMAKLQRELARVKPDVVIINNWAWMTRYPVNPPPYVRVINWDTPPPNTGLYSINFSFEARYLASLGDRSWSCHNTRGNTWGDYSLRDEAAFLQEVATLLAAGGRSLLSDDAYPSGNPDPAVFQLYKRVNERTRVLEPYLAGCRPVEDVAVLHSADSIWSKTPLKPSPGWLAGPAYDPVAGAHKALIEGHVQMGILNSDALREKLGRYKAVILPDQRILSSGECDAVRRFVEQGGAVIATHGTGTRDESGRPQADFALADVFGVRYCRTAEVARSFLRVKSPIPGFRIPAMDIQVEGGHPQVELTSAKLLLELVSATGPKLAPVPTAEGPGVTLNQFGKGKAIYCAAPIFAAYLRAGTGVLRRLAMWMLDLVHPEDARTIALEGAPANVELFYNQRGADRLVHLVNYAGDKREAGPPQMHEYVRVHGIRVRAKLNARPKRITAVPEGSPVSFEWRAPWAVFNAAPLAIHSVYLIEG